MCSDPHKDWHPQREVCYSTMAEAAANRMYVALHEKKPFHNGDFTRWAEKATKATPFHFQDGVEIRVAEVDLNPDDMFLSAPESFDDRRTEAETET